MAEAAAGEGHVRLQRVGHHRVPQQPLVQHAARAELLPAEVEQFTGHTELGAAGGRFAQHQGGGERGLAERFVDAVRVTELGGGVGGQRTDPVVRVEPGHGPGTHLVR
ncbi:hypothetical protein SALBM135S_08979 [Streptomyces alboniger]